MHINMLFTKYPLLVQPVKWGFFAAELWTDHGNGVTQTEPTILFPTGQTFTCDPPN